jgi:Phage capsid family
MNVSRPIPLRPDRNALAEAAGTSLVRAVLAAAHGRLARIDPVEFARRNWGIDGGREVGRLLTRAASAPATTSSAGWAAELSHTILQFLGLLVPVSAGAALLNRGTALSFDSGAGTISLPMMTIGQAGFVGQGKPIPVAQFQTSSLQLQPHKLALMSTLTAEMVASSSAEAIVRMALMESAARGLDAALFSANAASADAPPGLLHSLSPMVPSSTGSTWDDMVADLAALGGAVARVAGNQLVYICAPEQSLGIALRTPDFRYPVLSSSALPAKNVICVAGNALACAFAAAPEIDSSFENLVHMESATPGDIVSGAFSAPVASIFQSDSLTLRMTLTASWTMRAANAISFMNAVNW